MSTIKQAFSSLGVFRYTLTMGLGCFGGYMFAMYSFIYKLNGLDLTLERLILIAVMSIFAGISWGIGTWYLTQFLNRKYGNNSSKP